MKVHFNSSENLRSQIKTGELSADAFKNNWTEIFLIFLYAIALLKRKKIDVNSILCYYSQQLGPSERTTWCMWPDHRIRRLGSKWLEKKYSLPYRGLNGCISLLVVLKPNNTAPQ
ncbi:hypothetical protein KQX54_013157 [Cotesia glomerata]|uniref:Uncharacterized protein n=1 Tax=Cotesia glomerata TaxID=32391 RepID=A0AAV7J539_COTGL|nr:hypothetical protein KQX54_013157 [Cotesia glomerata]